MSLLHKSLVHKIKIHVLLYYGNDIMRKEYLVLHYKKDHAFPHISGFD